MHCMCNELDWFQSMPGVFAPTELGFYFPPKYELCLGLFFIIVYGRSNNSEEKEAFTAFPERPTEISSVGESCDLSAKNAL